MFNGQSKWKLGAHTWAWCSPPSLLPLRNGPLMPDVSSKRVPEFREDIFVQLEFFSTGAKMTAAPYNYSYIFKYIIIGEPSKTTPSAASIWFLFGFSCQGDLFASVFPFFSKVTWVWASRVYCTSSRRRNVRPSHLYFSFLSPLNLIKTDLSVLIHTFKNIP